MRAPRVQAKHLWLVVPGLIAVADPLLIRSGERTLSEQYNLWRESYPVANVVLVAVSTLLWMHLNRRPRFLARFDPLCYAAKRIAR